MSEATPKRESIRRRLLAFLIPSLLMLVLGAGAVTYLGAVRTANSAYDRALFDPVVDLAEHIKGGPENPHLELSGQAQQALLYDQIDRLVFQIRDPNGRIIAGVEDLPAPSGLASSRESFFDAVHRGDPIRVAAMRTQSGFEIQVGETRNKRDRLIRDILATELVPTLLIALVSTGLAWFGVARGLGPLQRVRGQLLQRSPQDLRPLDDREVPEELTPLVAAFNRLLHRLRDASDMQRRFLADAAHQLRTPLAGLQMHLELLLRRDLPAEVRDEVEAIQGATARSSRLARQLLALAKAESAGTGAEPRDLIDLKTVADAAARDWVPRAMERDIDLGFSLDSAPVRGDAVLLGELLNNLVDNALRYTSVGGTVTVRSEASNGYSILSVEDTGPGIPEASRKRVFERFFRVSGSPGDGSGLGLAIVKEVADRHGATIVLEAAAHGRGTRFIVTFPASGLDADSAS